MRTATSVTSAAFENRGPIRRIRRGATTAFAGTPTTWRRGRSIGHSINFWSDLAITAFAVVLIVEGIVLLVARNRTLLTIALVLTVATTLGNLLYLVLSYPDYGLAVMSAVAVIFGVYIALNQLAQLKRYGSVSGRASTP